MFNVSTDRLIISSALSLLMLTGCGESPERKAAESLLQEAEAAILSRKPEEGIQLLDSISKAYPEQTETRRSALALRPKATEIITIREIEQTDSLLAALELEYNQMEGLMKKISDRNLVEPYYVPAKAYNPNFVSSTGVQARVDLVGQFYLLSSVNGKTLKHVAVEFSNGKETVSTQTVKADGETNFRMGNSELITYEPGKCDTIGQFFVDNISVPVKGAFVSENGKKTPFGLTAAQVEAIADAYRYSHSIVDAREAAVHREKLERKLQVARDQMARTAEGDGR